MSGPDCQLRLRLRQGGEIALGPGKVALLEAVDRGGSIRAAAATLKMSYARAWQLIGTMNLCFGAALVETSKGGEKGGGARLSPLGREVLQRYRAVEAAMLAASGPERAALLALLSSEPEAGKDAPGSGSDY